MGLKGIKEKAKGLTQKYRYALIILMVGVILLVFPGKKTQNQTIQMQPEGQTDRYDLTVRSVEEILQTVQGAGKVKVLLSVETGEEKLYQTDTDVNDSGDKRVQTVIVADSQRCENGLIRQINPVSYKGVIVVCQGADSPSVRLAVTQAVSKITGLGSDAICVLKMQ